ncbi:uncharacterized protein LOC143423330 [Xylocopa sonorina]|uniref:uncharacterized protein LOC143423330 n=1 Tax=Xylocopa sonorina TaxID=1818115 RepID=UPI00403AB502
MDIADNADEALDPRIQIELENLNDATDDINKLETELDEAHTAFRQLLNETTKRLKDILNKVGNSSVEKARCYYEALEIARQAQVRCQQQAQLFQRASEIHAAAKETVALAESRFKAHQHEWNFDQAWQDMLNHATLKVMDAENQKAECGREHYRRAVLFHNAEKRLLELDEKHRRSIIKARPYFEVKAQCDQMLATQKERVECLQKAIQDAKTNYANSLRRLEEISNQIHQQRRDYDFIANGPREPGVGAELVSPQKIENCNSEFNQLNSNKIKYITNNQLKKYNRIQDYDNICQLQEDTEHLGKRSVDGSEATSSQWELELEANMENLNNLAIDNSVIDHDSLQFYNVESTRSNNFTRELSYNFLKGRDYSMQNLNRSKLLQNFQILKNPFVNMTSITHREQSNALKNEITDPVKLNKRKINLKYNTSKSLDNSPIRTNIFNLGSKLTEKGIRQSIAKYVPNNIFNFGFNNNKSENNSDGNLSVNLDTSSVDKYQNLVDVIDDKTDNVKFDTDATNSKHKMQSFTVKEVNNGLSAARKLDCAQLSTFNRLVDLKSRKDLLPATKWFRSNSLQFLFSDASSSPVKVKYVKSLSNENVSDKIITDNYNKYFAVERSTTEKLWNLNKLPLPSLYMKGNLLANSKRKSFSMINLGTERDFVLFSDLHLSNGKTTSTESLACAKDNSFLRTIKIKDKD